MALCLTSNLLTFILGAVGKTSLVLRYVEDTFNPSHITTLQVIIFLPVSHHRSAICTASLNVHIGIINNIFICYHL